MNFPSSGNSDQVLGPMAIGQKCAQELIRSFKGKGESDQDVPCSSIKESREHSKHEDHSKKESKLCKNEAI